MFKATKAAVGLLAVTTSITNVVADVAAATTGNYSPGNASFRRDYYPPSGKTPLSASILITTDDAYTLFVNGIKIDTGMDYQQAQRYCVPLVPDCNVFAIEGQNTLTAANPPGALAAIQVRYTDGFVEKVVTDSSWHGVTGAPAGFEQVAFDDSDWAVAIVQGSWPAWTGHITVAIPPADSDPGPNLRDASWIWTNEEKNAVAPVGARAFRKTVTLPAGQLADTITIDIIVDDKYTLYINGLLVGSVQQYDTAQRYQVNFVPSNTVTISVFGENIRGAAGLLASGAITGCACGCGASAVVNTDSSWKYSTTVSTGFIDPSFNDAAWPAAIVIEGPNGTQPYPPRPLPTSNSPQSGAISGAPSAPPASVVV